MAARALIAVTDFGVEEAELVEPLNALKKAGIEVTVASNSGESIQTVTGDKDWASKVNADSRLADAKASDYDLLVIPGGTVNADTLRIDEDGRRLVKEFATAGKPVGAICHGPWVLIDADVAKGKTMTSYISIRPDLENAGVSWVDKELFRCPGNPPSLRLWSTRSPDSHNFRRKGLASAGVGPFAYVQGHDDLCSETPKACDDAVDYPRYLHIVRLTSTQSNNYTHVSIWSRSCTSLTKRLTNDASRWHGAPKPSVGCRRDVRRRHHASHEATHCAVPRRFDDAVSLRRGCRGQG